MKPTKGEYRFLAIIWTVAFAAIFFAYMSAVNKQNKPELTECSVYVPDSNAVVITNCEMDNDPY